MKTKYRGVKYIGYSLGDLGAHGRQQLMITKGIVEAMQVGRGMPRLLKLKQAMWAWTAYARPHAEWAAAVWPAAAERAVATGLERTQDAALVALMGDAATTDARPSRALLLSVFDLWSLEHRRLLARVRYDEDHKLVQTRPRRAAIARHHRRLAQKKDIYADTSATGAIAAATKRLRRFESKHGMPTKRRKVRNAGDTPTDRDARAHGGGAGATAAAGGGAGDEDNNEAQDDEDSDSTEHEGSDDDDGDEFHQAKRRAGQWARRRVTRIVNAERKQAMKKAMLGSSGSVYKALRPSRKWLESVVFEGGADAASASVPALICGCFWPCTAIRPMGKRAICGACGATTSDLQVHFILGIGKDGVVCAGKADEARKQHDDEVRKLFRTHNRGGQLDEVRLRAPNSEELMALMLGNGGRALPAALAVVLPSVFAETLGAWAAEARQEQRQDDPTLPATEPPQHHEDFPFSIISIFHLPSRAQSERPPRAR